MLKDRILKAIAKRARWANMVKSLALMIVRIAKSVRKESTIRSWGIRVRRLQGVHPHKYDDESEWHDLQSGMRPVQQQNLRLDNVYCSKRPRGPGWMQRC